MIAHTEEDLAEAMRRDKKELKDKIESESGDVKRKMELETNEMRDRLQSEKKAASLAMEEEVEERKRDINQIRQTVSKRQGCQMAKFDPFLSLDCARVEGVGCNPKKGRDQILQRSVAEPESRSPKGQTHTISKSGYHLLAAMGE